MIADTAAHRPTSDSPSAYVKPTGPADMLNATAAAPGQQAIDGHPSDTMSRQPSVNGSNGPATPQGPVLDVRISSLEKGRKDLTIRLRARTNIPHYRSSVYPNILRTYREIALLCLALTLQHPSTIVQALPIPFPSLVSSQQGPASARSPAENAAIQHQEDIFLSQLQRWFQRLIADPVLLNAPELRSFIESEYSYHPTPPDPAVASPALKKRYSAGVAALHSAGVSGSYGPVDVGSSILGLPSGAGSSSTSATAAAKSIASSLLSTIGAGSGSGSMGFATSRSVHDEDDELVGAREEVTRLEMQFAQAAEGLDRLSIQRRSQMGATANLSVRMTNLAATEEVRPPSAKLGLPHALGCTGEMLRRVTDLEEGQSRMEVLTLGDMLAYQSLNARAAKEAMLSRNAVVEDLFNATKLVAARKQTAENLRGATNIRPERIDEAIQDFHEARERERDIAIYLQGISQGLKGSLRKHSKFAHADLEDAIVAHGRESLRRARITLEVIRGLRPEIRRVPQQAPAPQGPRIPVQPVPAVAPFPQQGLPASNPQFVPAVPQGVAPTQQVAAPPSHSVPPSTPGPVPVAAKEGPTAIPEPSASVVPPSGAPTSAPPTSDAPAQPGQTSPAIVAASAQPSEAPTATQSPAVSPPASVASPGPGTGPSMTQSLYQPANGSPSPFASMSSQAPGSPSPFARPGSASPLPPGHQQQQPFPNAGPPGASGMARSMFMERPSSQQQSPGSPGSVRPAPPNPFGTSTFGSNSTFLNGGSGLNSGRSRISARDAAKSLAGKF